MNFTSLLQEKRLTILLSGDIDHHAAKEIMESVSAKIRVYLPQICELDFSGVTFMDSSGIALVIHALRGMNQLGGTLRLTNVPPQPRKVLLASGIQKLVPLNQERSPA